MNLSVNGQSQVPPGFRFHPTEEELLQYYLKKKIASQKIDLDVIQDIDLNKLEPWDIQEKCRIGSAPQNDWYFFSHKDKKYPTGTRTNRATRAGFWKATGRDKVICGSSMRIGMRKTLVFYMGRAPHGEKSDWIMHEYRLHDVTHHRLHVSKPSGNDEGNGSEEGWVICRVFRKKNFVKADNNPTNRNSIDAHMEMVMSSKKAHHKDPMPSHIGNTTTADGFLHLPQLDSPTNYNPDLIVNYDRQNHHQASTLNWVELDRLVAYQLNGQPTNQFPCFNNNSNDDDDDNDDMPLPVNVATTFQDLLRSQSTRVFEEDEEAIDDQFWSFTKQSSCLDPMCHFSV
ncbi:hypothetical protein V2J09_022194 [Rumex salicifolius]